MAVRTAQQSYGVAAGGTRDLASFFDQLRREEIARQDRIVGLAQQVFERRRAEKKAESAEEKKRQKTTTAVGLGLAGAGVGGLIGGGALAMGLPGAIGLSGSGALMGAGLGGTLGTQLGSAIGGVPAGAVPNVGAPLAQMGQFQLGQEQRRDFLQQVPEVIESLKRTQAGPVQQFDTMPELENDIIKELVMQYIGRPY